MKKSCLIFLAALCLIWPTASMAENLPAFFSAVQEGMSDGLEAGVLKTATAMQQELTLTLDPQQERVEEGRTMTLLVTAGNPRPVETKVTLTLTLPKRMASTQSTEWTAVLPPAQMDEQTGVLLPSMTTFTRDITLMPGGSSEEAVLVCEMAMGTRFYRTSAPLALCVPDISASAMIRGTQEGRLHPGDAMTYVVKLANAGTAPKDVPVELTLPDGLTLSGNAPEGFLYTGSRLSGQLRVEAAQGEEPTVAALNIPVQVDADVLEGDADAMRLLAGQLRVDGERTALPRVQVCGPQISAKLLSDVDSLKQGEEMALRVVVVNSGLAGASVRVSCVLPEGLTLVEPEQEQETIAATPAEGILPPKDDSTSLEAAAVPAEIGWVQPVQDENGALVFDLYMDKASEHDGGVTANTQVLDLRVRAEQPQENIREQLLGTTLAWSTDEGETMLGEAVAVRVYKPMFLGLTCDEWSGIFWAGLLLLVTVSCLYAAVCADNRKNDCCCE